ncbi:hypothetical protein EYF80_056454 [Liparis tanakae]|uniref:Uncharacterized protein n=1 Tax=Liparis tanakae TaxID=230148 RepID=A0A4Z2EXT5_9TELE|nr:hypothetical protein EYF80_056454 [Liparis tanakae]
MCRCLVSSQLTMKDEVPKGEAAFGEDVSFWNDGVFIVADYLLSLSGPAVCVFLISVSFVSVAPPMTMDRSVKGKKKRNNNLRTTETDETEETDEERERLATLT